MTSEKTEPRIIGAEDVKQWLFFAREALKDGDALTRRDHPYTHCLGFMAGDHTWFVVALTQVKERSWGNSFKSNEDLRFFARCLGNPKGREALFEGGMLPRE